MRLKLSLATACATAVTLLLAGPVAAQTSSSCSLHVKKGSVHSCELTAASSTLTFRTLGHKGFSWKIVDESNADTVLASGDTSGPGKVTVTPGHVILLFVVGPGRMSGNTQSRTSRSR